MVVPSTGNSVNFLETLRQLFAIPSTFLHVPSTFFKKLTERPIILGGAVIPSTCKSVNYINICFIEFSLRRVGAGPISNTLPWFIVEKLIPKTLIDLLGWSILVFRRSLIHFCNRYLILTRVSRIAARPIQPKPFSQLRPASSQLSCQNRNVWHADKFPYIHRTIFKLRMWINPMISREDSEGWG